MAVSKELTVQEVINALTQIENMELEYFSNCIHQLSHYTHRRDHLAMKGNLEENETYGYYCKKVFECRTVVALEIMKVLSEVK